MTDWLEFFDAAWTRARAAGQPDDTADRSAWATCEVAYLDAARKPSAVGVCAECGLGGMSVLPFGVGDPTWLHAACWWEWRAGVLTEARAALLAAGALAPFEAGSATEAAR